MTARNDTERDTDSDAREGSRQRLTLLVTGRVQGVGYRAFVQRQALDFTLAGYAENLSDGRVEVVAEGDRQDLEGFLIKLKAGPSHAVVTTVEQSWGEVTGVAGFYTY